MEQDLELLRSSNIGKRLMDRAEITVENMINHMMAKDTWSQETEDVRNYRIRGLDRIRKQKLSDYLPGVNEVLKLYGI